MADEPTILTPEEKELQDIFKKTKATPKMARWIQLFLDKNNKVTFGNRTQSALLAYGLNKDDPTDYNSARHIGWENYTKVNNLAAEYLEQQGMNTAKILDLIVAQATSKNYGKALQILTEITGIYNPKPTTMIQNNTAIVQASMSDEQREDWNGKFKAFLKTQIRK